MTPILGGDKLKHLKSLDRRIVWLQASIEKVKEQGNDTQPRLREQSALIWATRLIRRWYNTNDGISNSCSNGEYIEKLTRLLKGGDKNV
jgi:hypothetical protein